MNIVYSFSIIVGSFSLSTITAYFICYFTNYPFINPMYNHNKRIDRIKDFAVNSPLLIAQATGFIYVMSDNIVPYGQHTWLESYYTMALYCVYIEALYYIYHRFIHKYYYVTVHKKHHQNVIVYPFDTFYLTEIDDFASILSIGLPLIFIKISVVEQFIITYMYITSSYLSHSELYWKHHSIHHKLLKYNYCILFPIFDILFGTYKIE